MKNFAMILSVLLLINTTIFADAGEDAAIAKCTKCHNLNIENNMPNLGAQTSEYLFQSSKDYLTGVRHSDAAVMMMKNRIKGIDDKTLKAISDYYSAGKAPTPVAGDVAVMEKGKDIYENGIQAKNVRACSDCHGRDGEGRAGGNAMNPRLAGQLVNFQVLQLQNYKAGLINDQKEMTEIASQLTDEEMTAVSTYLRSK